MKVVEVATLKCSAFFTVIPLLIIYDYDYTTYINNPTDKICIYSFKKNRPFKKMISKPARVNQKTSKRLIVQ